MTLLYRAGEVTPYKGLCFAAANYEAAAKWAIDLNRPESSIITLMVDDSTPCVLNTHGYVEADWYYGKVPVWMDQHNKEELIKKMSQWRIETTVGEAVELIQLFPNDSAIYVAHEIVWKV